MDPVQFAQNFEKEAYSSNMAGKKATDCAAATEQTLVETWHEEIITLLVQEGEALVDYIERLERVQE
jgi:hypothetical protein